MADISIPEDFLADFQNLSNASIRLYLVLIKLAGEMPDESKWVRCGYDALLFETSLGSKTQIRRGMIELVATGWIVGFTRGFLAGNKRLANQYKVSRVKDLSSAGEIIIKMQNFEKKGQKNDYSSN